MTLTKALQNYEDISWPSLSAEEEAAAVMAGVQAGLADVEAGRTMLLEDYRTEVKERRSLRDVRNLADKPDEAQAMERSR